MIDKNKFTKGDKIEIIKMFEEVKKNNRAKKEIENLLEKINKLEQKDDKRLKKVYGKKLTNEQRNLMQRIGKLYNRSLPNKNTLKRNLALYIAYMHAKTPPPEIIWKGVKPKPVTQQNKQFKWEGVQKKSIKQQINQARRNKRMRQHNGLKGLAASGVRQNNSLRGVQPQTQIQIDSRLRNALKETKSNDLRKTLIRKIREYKETINPTSAQLKKFQKWTATALNIAKNINDFKNGGKYRTIFNEASKYLEESGKFLGKIGTKAATAAVKGKRRIR